MTASTRTRRSIPRKDRASAVGLWTMAGSWSSQQLTDGFVPAYMLDEFGVSPRFATCLVSARLWIVNDDLEGWNFHDWHAHQPSREVVEARRKKNNERIAAWRAGKTGPGNSVTPALHEHVTESFGNDSETSPPTRPDPTRPDPTLLLEEQPSRTKRGHRLPDNWQPARELIQKAKADFPSVDLQEETEAFCEWFHAKSGRDAAKLDWDLAWRGWMRRTHKKNLERNPHAGSADPYRKHRMLG